MIIFLYYSRKWIILSNTGVLSFISRKFFWQLETPSVQMWRKLLQNIVSFLSLGIFWKGKQCYQLKMLKKRSAEISCFQMPPWGTKLAAYLATVLIPGVCDGTQALWWLKSSTSHSDLLPNLGSRNPLHSILNDFCLYIHKNLSILLIFLKN